jgi:hypothetical protein
LAAADGSAIFSSSFFLMPTILITPLLTAAGLAGFWLFRRSVDFFDHI